MKANNYKNYESIIVKITKEEHPIIYQQIVDEQVSLGVPKEQAEEYAEGHEIQLELYYQKDYGLFGVDAEAVDEQVDLCSPYNKEEIEYEEEEWED